MNKTTKKDLEGMFQDRNVIEKELENIVLNYEDYKNEYADTVYQFIIDAGIFYVACSDETQGLDLIIDHIEDEGLEGWFIEVGVDNDDCIIDTDGNRYYNDEYAIGGNYGRYLYTGGNFRIEELDIWNKKKEF